MTDVMLNLQFCFLYHSGSVEEIIFEARLHHENGDTYAKDPDYINGLPGYSLVLREHLQVYESEVVEMVESGSSSRTKLVLNNFPPGSVLVVR